MKALNSIILSGCLLISWGSAFATAVSDLTPDRLVVFDDQANTMSGVAVWARNGNISVAGSRPGSNHFYRANAQTNANLLAYVQWSFMNFRVGRMIASASLSVPPENNGNVYPVAAGVNWCGYFQNTEQSFIESPIFTNGIGTLYFDALLGENVSLAPIIKISITTNILDAGSIVYPIPEGVWEEVRSIELTSTQLSQHVITLNYSCPIAIRLERTTQNGIARDDSFVSIDNIRVSEPPADVVMKKSAMPFNVYPSVNNNMNVQFRIDNMPGPNSTKASTRTNVLLVSRWNYLNQVTTPWVTNTLQCVNTGDGAGNGELWQPQTPMRKYPDAGDLEYFFICHFNGTYYQSYDYTVYPKVLNPALFPPENLSPRVFSTAGITHNPATNTPFVFPLRLFPSLHDTLSTLLYVNGSPTPVMLPMSLCGTNKWQAKFDIGNYPDTTNLLWYFESTGAFTNNFRITEDKTYWSSFSRQNGILPQRDTCTPTDASITNHPEEWFSVTVTPGDSGYLFFTLDTRQNECIATRGEYQNFNAWNTGATAQNSFTDADDKSSKIAYSQNFSNGWQQSSFTGLSNWFGTVSFTGQTATVRMGPEQVLDQPGMWQAGSFQYVAERTAISGLVADAQTTGQRRNQGIRLLGGISGYDYGYYQGSLGQQNAINGIGTITYKARMSRPIALDSDYNYNVAYRWTDMMRTNYVVRSNISAASVNDMSPENPSVSLIAYYQSPRKFYEYRLIQIPDSRDLGSGTTIYVGRNKRVRHEIWKWNGATPVRLAYAERTTMTWPDLNYDGWLYSAPIYLTSFRLYNNTGPTSVSMSVSYNNQVIPFTAENGAFIANGAVVDSSSPILFGTYGFHSADCRIIMPEMQIGASGPDGTDTGNIQAVVVGGASGNQANEWYWPSELYSLSGNTFWASTHSTSVKVLTGTSELGPWTPFATQTVNSYAYQTFTSTTNTWNSLCARIQANDRVGVVIDGVHVQSWRGETVTATPFDQWRGTEGWISSNATDKTYAHLDASQANPSLIQCVRSERILGLGSISFDYRVTAVPAQIKIQYTANVIPLDETNTGWVDVTNLTFNGTTAWSNAYYYLGIAPATNIYVRIINNTVTNRRATVDLKNITLWNNPTNSPTDWAAYNMKISDTETNKWWLDKSRSGYMNNSTTANIIPGRPMTMYNPYIMAPRLAHGLGSISFLARAFTTGYAAGDTNTSITVYATTEAWDKYKPDVLWTKLYTFTGITNSFYRTFVYTHPTMPNNIKAVKLVVHGVLPVIGTPQRVCVDEIMVTEAFYPSFDITGVKMFKDGSDLTQQPLEGEAIALEAQLTDVKNDPEAINLFATYVLGAETWGVTNAPAEQRITLPMTLIDPENRIYRTSASIPSQSTGTVVQYCVWAEYGDSGALHIEQSPDTTDHFTAPPWYALDLNQIRAPLWSPYYIVAGTNSLSSLAPTVQNVPYTGGVFSVFVGARSNWIAQCNTSWAIPLETAGPSATNTLYRVSPNAGKIGRSANLTFTCGLGSDTLLINQDPAPTNFDAVVESTGLEWTMGGDMLWFEQTQTVKEGPSALQSGPITNNLQSWIETSVAGPGTLSFWWRVSSEGGYDILTCSIDASPQKTISGDKSGWMLETFALGDGPHIIRWTYTKDDSNSQGEDCGRLDALQWIPTPPLFGFALWASNAGLLGTQADLFLQDRNLDGIANGFEYAFGTNLPLSSLLLNIRFINGKPIVEIPKQDETTLPYVDVFVRGSTNLLDWTLPMIPAIDSTGKPAHRSWHEPDGTPPAKAFFKLEAELK